MSDESIGVGDLVMVIRPAPCCGNADSIGRIFKVTELHHRPGICAYCRVSTNRSLATDGNGWSYSVSRLKKIKPLPEQQETKIKEFVPA